MFIPNTVFGKLFKTYLSGAPHPGKIRIQNLLGRWLFSKGLLIKNSNGTVFSLDANDWITRFILRHGNYEAGSVLLANGILKNGGLFVDIGANFGLFTCQLANENKNIKVIAVEPNYKIVGRLLKNIYLNNLEERVKIYNMAISDKFDLLTINQPASDNIGTTVTGTSQDGILSVLSCSLSYITEQPGNTIIDLLKIDIEGNEFNVLESFPFDQKKINNIIVEYNENARVSFSDLKFFFNKKGFDCFDIYGHALEQQSAGIPENNLWFINKQTEKFKS